MRLIGIAEERGDVSPRPAAAEPKRVTEADDARKGLRRDSDVTREEPAEVLSSHARGLCHAIDVATAGRA